MLRRPATPPPVQPEWPLADAVDMLRIWREAGSPPIRLRAGVHIIDFEKWLDYPTPPAMLHTHIGAVTDFIDRLARGEPVARAEDEDDWGSSVAGLPVPDAYRHVAVVVDDGGLSDASPAEADAPWMAGMEAMPAPEPETEPGSETATEGVEPPDTEPEPETAGLGLPATDVAPALFADAEPATEPLEPATESPEPDALEPDSPAPDPEPESAATSVASEPVASEPVASEPAASGEKADEGAGQQASLF